MADDGEWPGAETQAEQPPLRQRLAENGGLVRVLPGICARARAATGCCCRIIWRWVWRRARPQRRASFWAHTAQRNRR